MYKKKWIIVVGTGTSQEPLIKKSKEKGFKVLGIDRNPNYKIIDRAIKFSTYEYKKVIEEIKVQNKKIRYVNNEKKGCNTCIYWLNRKNFN